MNLYQDIIAPKRNQIIELAQKYGAYDVRVFGSVARGDCDDDSDIDFLAKFSPDTGLFEHAALIREMEAMLGRKVDVVSENALRERFRERILSEAKPL